MARRKINILLKEILSAEKFPCLNAKLFDPSPPLPLPLLSSYDLLFQVVSGSLHSTNPLSSPSPFFLRTIYSFKSFQAPYIQRIQNDKHVAEKVTKDELKLTIAYPLLS